MKRLRDRTLGAAVVLITCLAMAGCVGLPTEGPVVEATGDGREDIDRAADIDARPPTPGASRVQVVVGFLDAMTAWPIQTNIAQQYLTSDAAQRWHPEAGTIVYGESLPPEENARGARVELASADLLDSSGGWRGSLSAEDLVLDLRIVMEDGELRIANPPDALVVPARWFQQRFRQVSLYFLDPSGRVVVPEPVFVPIGAQRATSLVSALVGGPPAGLEDVVHTAIPEGLDVGLSVPVSSSGVARIDLVGDVAPMTSQAQELMMAQFAWTLRQDPAITAFRVTVDGTEVTVGPGGSPYDVNGAARYDPAGSDATRLLHALHDGVLVTGTFSGLEPVSGPFGTGETTLTAVAVTPDGRHAAGIARRGRALLRAAVQTGDGASVVIADGTALQRPSWDAADRLWVLDRTESGARVLAVEGEEVKELVVPDVTGENARHLVVSRDGTRVAAVVRSGGRDRVVTARVVLDGQGRIRDVVGATVVRGPEAARVIDVAWSDPVRLSLLTPAAAGDLHEVSTLPASGGFLDTSEGTEVLRGAVRGLAASPSGGRVLVERPQSIVDVLTRESTTLEEGVRGVRYGG
jgi:hypothetical protein